MSLKYVKDTALDTLVNIVDAQYQGDPLGTPINKAHVKDNIVTYIKDAGLALQPNRSYMVNPGYSTLGNPFFATVLAAVAQIVTDGSSPSDKAFIDTKHGEYTEDLTLSHNGYVITQGNSALGSVINGTVGISAGIWVFKNIRFLKDITLSGGTAIFLDCSQTAGKTLITGSANVCISNALKWGTINISGNDNNVFINKVADIAGDTGESIVIEVGLTGGVYSVRHCELQGAITEGTALTEDIGNSTGVEPLFSV